MGVTSILLALGATIVIIGPKDLPIVARRIGYSIGLSVSFMRNARLAIRELSKDPEVASMTKDVEKGIEDLRRIRADIQSLSARRVVPQVLDRLTQSSAESNVELDAPVKKSHASAAVVVGADEPLPVMPSLKSRMYDPSHTDKMEVTGGADLLAECIQQREIARSWTKQ